VADCGRLRLAEFVRRRRRVEVLPLVSCLQNEFCSLLYRVRVQGGEDS